MISSTTGLQKISSAKLTGLDRLGMNAEVRVCCTKLTGLDRLGMNAEARVFCTKPTGLDRLGMNAEARVFCTKLTGLQRLGINADCMWVAQSSKAEKGWAYMWMRVCVWLMCTFS